MKRRSVFPFPMRVLVVEDEVRVAENIAAALRESAGLAVDLAPSGPEGVEFARQANYDLIILDLMLPGMSGQTVLQDLRANGQTAPVLILTAVAEKASVVRLLDAGADDYLAKPFDLGELLARSKALIRRGKGLSHPKIQVADLVIDTLEKTVTVAGDPVELSPTEYRALEYLSHRPRSVISKQVLLEHLYDYNWEHHSNVIEAHISNLRRKLNRGKTSDRGPWIETLRGRGYRLMSAAAPAPRSQAS
jgi:DNA-binding response OmpR family regulator